MAIGCRRTSRGAACHGIDQLDVGDTLTVRFSDNTEDNYDIVDSTIVPDTAVEIPDPVSDTTKITLFSCTRADGSADGTSHRYVITAELR